MNIIVMFSSLNYSVLLSTRHDCEIHCKCNRDKKIKVTYFLSEYIFIFYYLFIIILINLTI